MSENKGEIVIYTDAAGSVQTEVRLEAETLWLTQNQLSELFATDRTSIVKHIKNILETEELEEAATCAKFAQVQQEGNRQVRREILYYNLDMILSVGYRVNSKQGTRFRIWANRVLKEHLVQGYTINQQRLQEQQENIQRLRQSIQMVERSLSKQIHSIDDARNVFRILSEFSKGLDILDDYDHEKLEMKGKTDRAAIKIEPEEFLGLVREMRRDFDSDVFGRPKDSSFESSVRQIYQSYDRKELYPALEDKAAMLLYLVVKNHSFVDGNKRIAAALFLYFLDKNGLLFRADGTRRISDEGLAALSLLIAVSKPEEKDTMVKIVITVLNRSHL
ncbi:RhuM family protein [Marispirochaeta sp.]|uniref:RhuM family protein n=1 Tax=Marispirochaeta sp. TaxID=2038653 RepID=UPI0029C66DEE|nr:RhuM family protein [Marispirochaeta sp.]